MDEPETADPLTDERLQRIRLLWDSHGYIGSGDFEDLLTEFERMRKAAVQPLTPCWKPRDTWEASCVFCGAPRGVACDPAPEQTHPAGWVS